MFTTKYQKKTKIHTFVEFNQTENLIAVFHSTRVYLKHALYRESRSGRNISIKLYPVGTFVRDSGIGSLNGTIVGVFPVTLHSF